ncbi:MAG: hypothetical protein SFX19_10520 [Alphaproteobacteria bacterium]|nr:hypothetical protein [Alphaproteobacteria bacterium]
MSNLSFQEKLVLENNYGVVLCNSSTEEGEPFFHYVMADRKHIEQMHRDYESGAKVDFSAYGDIILSGWGKTPPLEYEMIISEYFQEN